MGRVALAPERDRRGGAVDPAEVVGGQLEVVEVSFPVPRAPVVLLGWAGGSFHPLDLAPDGYRVRYCVTGMDAGKAADARTAEEPEVDRYLLQLWPAPPEPDRVVRQSSGTARYWHDYARSTPTQEQVRARRAELARQRQQEIELAQQQRENLLRRGRPAGPLGDVPSARTVMQLDRLLAEAIAVASPERQRALARWTARRALAEAGLESIDWIAAGLSALDADEPLPAPFDDERGRTCVQQAMAFPALVAAAHPDPTIAVFDAIHHATAAFGAPGHRRLYAELWRAATDGTPSSNRRS